MGGEGWAERAQRQQTRGGVVVVSCNGVHTAATEQEGRMLEGRMLEVRKRSNYTDKGGGGGSMYKVP